MIDVITPPTGLRWVHDPRDADALPWYLVHPPTGRTVWATRDRQGAGALFAMNPDLLEIVLRKNQ